MLTEQHRVGIVEDSRSCDYLLALWEDEMHNCMPAEFACLPHELLGRISRWGINGSGQINRVVYDVTGKVAATIEWD